MRTLSEDTKKKREISKNIFPVYKIWSGNTIKFCFPETKNSLYLKGLML